jgi:hypothetical protein
MKTIIAIVLICLCVLLGFTAYALFIEPIFELELWCGCKLAVAALLICFMATIFFVLQLVVAVMDFLFY